MAPDLADDTAGAPRRTQADGERARDIERHLLSAVDRLSVGWAAEELSTEEHGLLLLCALELGRHAGAHPLRALCRDTRAGRPRAKSDSGDHRQSKRQSSAKRGAFIDAQGYDAGKKVTGRKRHILVDTLGLLLSVAVHSADIQDRDGAALVLDPRTRALFPFILRIFADAGYQGARAALAAASTGNWIIEIVKRNELHKFVVLPKRWIVERTLAWISRNRRLARDYERYARTVVGYIRLAMIRIMLRRLARPNNCSRITTS
jgi:transposase